MKPTAFDLFHPAVALAYFAVLLVLGMAAMHPVYLGITFAGALVCGVVLRGWRAVGRMLAWQVPLAVVVALANFLLSASGSTELFRVGGHAFYLESLVYGVCMGLMLASVLQVFANASQVLTSDKVMALFGGVAPTVGLMLSMTARLVPQFARRGRDIGGVAHACTAAGPQANVARGEGAAAANAEESANAGAGMHPSASGREAFAAKRSSLRRGEGADSPAAAPARRLRVRENLRLTSVLMGWGMEDSLEVADAMKARGWGASARRTTYARFRFRRLDAAVLAALGALALASAAAAWVACGQFWFYPALHGWAPWQSYAPYVLFVLFPLVIEARERLLWKE